MAKRHGDVLAMKGDRTSGIYATSATIYAVMLECWEDLRYRLYFTIPQAF